MYYVVKILLFVAFVDEPSGHTFGGTTVVGGCKPIAFPDKLGIRGSMIWTSFFLFFHSVSFRWSIKRL